MLKIDHREMANVASVVSYEPKSSEPSSGSLCIDPSSPSLLFLVAFGPIIISQNYQFLFVRLILRPLALPHIFSFGLSTCCSCVIVVFP